MRSSTSNSDARFLVAFALTIVTLISVWEIVLRRKASATVDLAIQAPPLSSSTKRTDEWLVFGNCLMMTGISPQRLNDELGHKDERAIINIAWHEQSPIAFFQYLKTTNHYPHVVITNVSSWLNGTNFEQEGMLMTKSDPLSLLPHVEGVDANKETPENNQAYRATGSEERTWQRSAENRLTNWSGSTLLALGHRYHLFDYSMFLGSLARTANLDEALYQLNMQSWYKVTSSETDGWGFLGLHVSYSPQWKSGLETMAGRALQRMRLSMLLTPTYWSLLEAGIQDLQAHGTRVIVVRMPEHPDIAAFNEQTYKLSSHLSDLQARLQAFVLDISALGPPDGVRLFDAVHPDFDAAVTITHKLGGWVNENRKAIEP